MPVKSLLCLATVLCFGIVGCDDPEVEETVTNALIYGAVTAEVQCSGRVETIGCDASSSDLPYYQFKSSVFLDGSSVSSYSLLCTWGADKFDFTRFNKRSEPFGVVEAQIRGGHIGVVAANGDLEFHFQGSLSGSSPLNHHPTIPIVNDCTGFNMEAFGVSP